MGQVGRDGFYYRIHILTGKPTHHYYRTSKFARRLVSTTPYAQSLGSFLWKRRRGISHVLFNSFQIAFPPTAIPSPPKICPNHFFQGSFPQFLSISFGLNLRLGVGWWKSFWLAFHCFALQCSVKTQSRGRRRASRKLCRCRRFGRFRQRGRLFGRR